MGKTHAEYVKEYINQLKGIGENEQGNAAYAEYLAHLAQLSEKLNQYYEADENGEYPHLTTDNISELRNLYRTVMDAGKAFEDNVKAKKVPGNHVKEFRRIVNHLDNVLQEDMAALSSVVGTVNESLPDIIANARGYELEIDGELDAVGGNISERTPISFTDKNGNKVNGFFTESTKLDLEGEREKILQEATEGHPEYRLFFEAIMDELINADNLEDSFGHVESVNERIAAALKRVDGYHENNVNLNKLKDFFDLDIINFDSLYKSIHNQSKAFRNIYTEMKNDENYVTNMVNFLRNNARYHIKYGANLYTAKIANGSVIEERNAAMTAVSDLLGCDKLLARSTKMTVIHNGKKKMGVFMEKAEGFSCTDTSREALWDKIDENSCTPELFRDIANLQVIDFICGNIDRHERNMYYKTAMVNGVAKITGLVGIDNDCSFGTLNSGKIPGCSLDLKALKCMDSDMADRVLAITPEMLKTLLRNYQLEDCQVKAAGDRLKLLQNTIIKNKKLGKDKADIKFVKSDEWKNQKLDEMCAYEPEGNYDESNHFARVRHMARHIKDGIDAIARDNEDMAQLRENYPDIFSKSKFEFREAHTFAENGEQGIKLSKDMIELLTKEAAAEKIWYGSSVYDDMSKALDDVKKIVNNMNHASDVVDWRALQHKYEVLGTKVDDYLFKKNEEAKTGKLSKVANKRVKVAMDIRNYIQKRIISSKKVCAEKKAQNADAVITKDALETEKNRLATELNGQRFDEVKFARWRTISNALEHLQKKNADSMKKQTLDDNIVKLIKSGAINGINKTFAERPCDLDKANLEFVKNYKPEIKEDMNNIDDNHIVENKVNVAEEIDLIK